jgi:hypothetical protein
LPENRSRRQLLRTAALFRELNDAVQVYFEGDGATQSAFVCECSDSSCVGMIRLTPTEYADIRAHPTRFFVLPGHELPDLERVVEANGHFTVVETPVVP